MSFQQCPRDDTYAAPDLRKNRVRLYKVVWNAKGCTRALWNNVSSYLIIDNVTWNDAGVYNCNASNYDDAVSFLAQGTTLQIGKWVESYHAVSMHVISVCFIAVLAPGMSMTMGTTIAIGELNTFSLHDVLYT